MVFYYKYFLFLDFAFLKAMKKYVSDQYNFKIYNLNKSK